jgi:hypothetical protein
MSMPTIADVARLVQASTLEVRQLQASLAAMAADLAALRAALASRDRAPATPHVRRRNAKQEATDTAVAQQLVPLIYARLGAGMFEAGEILARAECDPQIELALQPLIAGRRSRLATAQSLGRLLGRCAGRTFGCYELRRLRETAPQLFEVVSNRL